MKRFISVLCALLLTISISINSFAENVTIEVDPSEKDRISLTDIKKTDFKVNGNLKGVDLKTQVVDKDGKPINYSIFNEDLENVETSLRAFNKITPKSAKLEIAAYKEGKLVSNVINLPVQFEYLFGKIDYVKPIEIVVYEGDKVELPEEVEVFLLNGAIGTAEVKWNISGKDLTAIGKQEILGKVNGYDGDAKLTLLVKEKERVAQVLEPQIVLLKGEELILPSELLVTTNTGKKSFKKVIWNKDGFSKDLKTIQKISGKIEGYGTVNAKVQIIEADDKPEFANEALLKYLEVSNLSEILSLDTANISYATLSNEDVSDFKYFKNITGIDASMAGFKPDFKGITGLSKLKSLNLYANEFSDLSSIAYLDTIEELIVHKNKIKDLTPIKNFKNLKELNISGNDIKDLSPLEDLPLESLEISEYLISKLDLTPLMGKKNLLINGKPLSEYNINIINFKDNFANVETDVEEYIPPKKVKFNGEIVYVDWDEEMVDMKGKDVYDLGGSVGKERLTLRITKIDFKDTVVTFEDPAVTKAVRKAVDRPKGYIMLSDVINLKNLEIIGQGVKSLKGVEQLKNLEKLGLYANYINAGQLIYVKNLTKLKSLDLADNNLLEIPEESFDKLVNLEELVLDHTGINTLDKNMMSKLVSLRDLLIEKNGFTNLDFLEDNTSIKNILFRDNKIKDISGVRNNKNLEMFWGGGNEVSDISVLKGQKELNYFSMKNNKISDISALKDANKLTNVYLSGNQIKDISALEGKSFLKSLELDHNRISNIEPLKGLTNLERLYLNDNRIESFEPLKGLVNLRVLYLKNNLTDDYSPLDGIINNIKSKDF